MAADWHVNGDPDRRPRRPSRARKGS
jgi:hypothetical protein